MEDRGALLVLDDVEIGGMQDSARQASARETPSGRSAWRTGALVGAALVVGYLAGSRGGAGGAGGEEHPLSVRLVGATKLDELAEQEQDCGLTKDSKLLMLMSSSGIRGPDIRSSLDKMVGSLPSADGKADYSKLTLLELYDPCMLKESFWNDDHKDFGKGMGYKKANLQNLSPDAVKEFFGFTGSEGQALDTSWCYDEWTNSSATGGLRDLGFGNHRAIGILDYMMTPDEFKELVKIDLGTEGAEKAKALMKTLQEKEVPDALKELIQKADVIAASGGNPDLYNFALRAFPAVAKLLTERLQAGEAVYMGRSAGSMVVGANAGFSYEPTTSMLQVALSGDDTSLGLLPGCVMKPHFKTEVHEIQAGMVESISGLHVVRMPNMMALACQTGSCVLQGSPAEQDLQWQTSPGHYMEHLAALFNGKVGLRETGETSD